MKKKQWYQIDESCNSIVEFIANYFEWYSLEETLNHCLKMRYDSSQHYRKLILDLKIAITTCPEKIIEAFDQIDKVPVYYPEGLPRNINESMLLLERVVAFLEAHQLNPSNPKILDNKKQMELDKQISKIVDDFCRSLRIEFNGKLGI